MINIDQWQLPLPLNDEQQKDLSNCQEKLKALLNLPIRVHCLATETLWTNPIEQTNLPMNNRNPLKMYWQRNLQELRLFFKLNETNSSKLDANLIEIHQRRRLSTNRYVKQELNQSSVLVSFPSNSVTHHHSLSITVTGKHSLLEFQIPSTETNLIYRGSYRKMGEDAQLRSVTALFNCTLQLDDDMALILGEYGLCRLLSS